MQKLSGTSSGENNKSCSSFYNESNKIGMHFLIFLQFSTEFTRISKTAILFEIHFCTQDPGKFRDLTNMPLLCGSALRKSSHLAMWPLGAVADAGGAIPASSSPGLAGEGGRLTRGSPENVLWARLVEKGYRPGWFAAPGGGRRWSRRSGEVAARWNTEARRRASLGAREGEGHVSWGNRPVGP
jgi:hypothetical protein